ncbi:tetratricopeptide repeat protein [Butyrivibrio sp. FCS014]|uniref:tetratricopeptide repeat protein n=1 Tax=Butyrivibrio sp. FCS014 TaxID=1408304 RepID=UPI0004661304|nr:tetratricopeptide repeat protein [Butyrivibrio sp. FCS014]
MDISVSNNYRKKGKTGRIAVAKSSVRRSKSRLSAKPFIITGLALIVLGVSGFFVYNNLPSVQVNKAIAAGDKYLETSDYQSAIDSYNEAIEIDSHSVTAYSNMAGAYLSNNDAESAKKVLYAGWENTENTGLLDNYHTVILNEAVDAMNSQTANMNTAFAILSVLKDDNSSSDAVKLLDAAYDRVFKDAYGYDEDAFFRSESSTYSSENGSATFSYSEYAGFVNELLAIYKAAPSDELKEVILKYAVPGLESFTMNYEDAVAYKAVLDDVESSVGSADGLASFKKCIENAEDVQSVFTDIFAQLDVGNVDELRGFIVSDEYIALRDVFLNKIETPLENTTYIPVSREAVIFNSNEGNWSYRFLNFDENPSTAGVLTIWANYFEDGGIQRCAISYEPASVDDSYYPHTKYSVTYLNSYVTQGNSTKVPKMNYRLETSITMQDGEEEETIITDWGGPNEATMDIDTIESRIRA